MTDLIPFDFEQCPVRVVLCGEAPVQEIGAILNILADEAARVVPSHQPKHKRPMND